mgnify:CR=1 FL=1
MQRNHDIAQRKGRAATYYAAPERESGNTVRQQAGLFVSERLLQEVTDAVPEPLLVLNGQRQVVFANQPALDLAGVPSRQQALGLRPGELLNCEHADEMPAGCGTSEFCSVCGAVQVILSGLRGEEDVKECHITTADHGAFDLLVSSKPLEVAGERFTIFSVRDISHEKRRRMLERLFFHDILNTAGGLRGMSEILNSAGDEDEFARTKTMIHGLADELIEEIEAQRDLSAAENSELEIRIEGIQPARMVERVVAAYRTHGSAQKRTIRTELPHELSPLDSDSRLLRRILGNMIKNGLEATAAGGIVTVGAAEREDNGTPGVEFYVHNEKFIPKRVQLQVFQRSFSTKGDDRGLGTYSMRLLGEHYFGGRVRFTTDEAEGTTFYAWIPLQPGGRAAEIAEGAPGGDHGEDHRGEEEKT